MGLLNHIILLLLIVVLNDTVMSVVSSIIEHHYRTLNNCTCLPHYMCKDDMADNIADGLVDIRALKSHPCENYFEFCCEHPINDIKVEPPKSKKNVDESLKRCGYGGNSDSFDYRIIGDESRNAEFAEFPWSVIIIHVQPITNQAIYKCGGSLIHPQVILTAAHCLKDHGNGNWIVRAGEWNTSNEEEPIPHQEKEVKEFAVHPYYHPLSLKNDVALLILSEPFQLADNVRTVCLPNANNRGVDNMKCVATGWGKNAFRKGKHSNVLKKVEVPMIPKEECQKSLRKTRLGKFYRLHRSFVCAGGEMNKDTCKGDGGSPLVCPFPEQRGRYFQVGIVAWGIGCGENNTPSAYVNVALYVDWINKQLRARNFDSNYYESM